MSDSNKNVLSITNAQSNLAGVLALAITIPGTCICFMVLACYAVAAIFPKGRNQLDRVSFRLLVYALVFKVLFGISYAITHTTPGPGCNFGAFAANFTLSFSTFLITCIGINLQLVLVQGVDGNMMEKYYVIVSTILSVALNVPPFALHQFGWDEESSTCWYKNPDDGIRLRWIIGTQSFWIALAATIQTVCSGVVLVWIFRFHWLTDGLERAVSTSTLDGTNTSSNNTNPISFSRSTVARVFREHPEYRNVVLRIALYPIISLMVNYSTVVLDLNMTIRGINTQLLHFSRSDFRLMVLDLTLSGVRTLVYGLLAFMDPAFVGAMRELFSNHNNKTSKKSRPLTTILFASRGTAAAMARSNATNTLGGGSESGMEINPLQSAETMRIKIELDDSEIIAASQDSDLGDARTCVLRSKELQTFKRQL